MKEIGRLVARIKAYDTQRETRKVEALERDDDPTAEREVVRLSAEIQKCAAEITKLAAAQLKAGKPLGPVDAGAQSAEVQGFLKELSKLSTGGASKDAGALGGDAKKLEEAHKQRAAALERELKDTDEAIRRLRKDREQLARERAKVEDQKKQLAREQYRLGKERAKPSKERAEDEKQVARLKKEKEALLLKLKAAKGEARVPLEQKVRELNAKLKRAEHAAKHHAYQSKQLDGLDGSLQKEVKQLDKALKALDEQDARLQKDLGKLEERRRKVSKQLQDEKGQLEGLAQAGRRLKVGA